MKHRTTFKTLLLLGLILHVLVGAQVGSAQIISDGSLPTPTAVNTVGNVSTITGGTQPNGGQNLFHSFSQFDVLVGQTALFQRVAGAPDPSISNIVGRITNGNVSSILGTVNTTDGFPNASLFLLNPAGFFFGANATLSIGGAFLATTANAFVMEDGTIFPATGPILAANLSVSPVVAMEFLGDNAPQIAQSNAAAIDVQGLNAQGSNVTLVGRDAVHPDDTDIPGVQVSGTLVSPGAEVILASVDSPGQAVLGSIDVDGFASLGEVNISAPGRVDVSGDGGGTVVIRAGQFMMNGGQVLAHTTADINGAPVGIDIQVSDTVTLQGTARLGSDTEGAGSAGNVTVSGMTVTLKDKANLSSQTSGDGAGGNVTVSGTTVTMQSSAQGVPNLSTLTAGGNGAGGNVTVSGNTVEIHGSLGSDTEGGGAGGNVTVSGNTVEIHGNLSSETEGDGAGGNVTVSGNTVTVEGILRSRTFANGPGGNVTVSGNTVTVQEFADLSSDTLGNAAAGNVTVSGDTVTVQGKAHLTSNTQLAAGAGGDVTVSGTTVTLAGSDTVAEPGIGDNVVLLDTSSQGGAGAAGNVTVSGDTVTVQDARLSSGASGAGAAGNVTVSGNTVTVQLGEEEANLNTSTTGSGAGGSVMVSGTNVTLAGIQPMVGEPVLTKHKVLLQSNTFGDGNAGSLTVSGTTVTLKDNVLLDSSSHSGAGTAGAVTVSGDTVSLADTELITLASGNGGGGSISVDASGPNTLTLQNTTINAKVRDVPAIVDPDTGRADISLASPTITITGGEITAETNGTRNAGQIFFETDSLTAELLNISTSGPATNGGKAGDIIFSGYDTNGISPLNISLDAVQVRSTASGVNKGGSIKVNSQSAINLIELNSFAIPSSLEALVNFKTAGEATSTGLANVEFTSPSITIDGVDINTSSGGDRDAGQILFKTNSLTTNDINITSNGLGGTAQEPGGAAGNIIFSQFDSQVNTPMTLTLTDTLVSTAAERPGVPAQGGNTFGKGGAIKMESQSPLTIMLNNSSLDAKVTNKADTEAASSGLGNLEATAPSITITGGTITTETNGTRNAGQILFETDSLTTNNTTITSSSTQAADGAAGSITFSGFDDNGVSPTTLSFSNTTVSTVADGTSQGGSIGLNSNSGLTVALTNSTLDATVKDLAVGEPQGTGLANVEATAPTISISGGSLTAASEGTRQSGSITMTATQSATLTNTEVSVESSGPANAGDILIDGGNTARFQNTTVSTEALQASGGNIKVNAEQLIFVNNSTFIADVQGSAETAGGTIDLDPQFIIIRNSQFLARALFGSGGSINLVGDVILVDPFSVFDVSSAFGTSGTITVSSPIQNLSGAIAPLPEGIVDVAQLVGQHCAAQQGGQLSSFVEAGRDVVPPGPMDYLTSPLFLPVPALGERQSSTRPFTHLAAQRLGLATGAPAIDVVMSLILAGSDASRGCSFL